jgi:hypothetical protein
LILRCNPPGNLLLFLRHSLQDNQRFPLHHCQRNNHCRNLHYNQPINHPCSRHYSRLVHRQHSRHDNLFDVQVLSQANNPLFSPQKSHRRVPLGSLHTNPRCIRHHNQQKYHQVSRLTFQAGSPHHSQVAFLPDSRLDNLREIQLDSLVASRLRNLRNSL